MKLTHRVLWILALLGASLLGGLLANFFSTGSVQAAGLNVPVKVTLLDVPNASTNPDEFGTTAVKIADIGSFTVENSSSLVEVTHNGRLLVDSFSGTNSVYYELRVQGPTGIYVSPLQPSGLAQVRYQEAGQYVLVSFTGFWKNLAVGSNTVSMWVRTLSGTANNAFLDPGSFGSNIVIVKEYLPFGATYLPLIER